MRRPHDPSKPGPGPSSPPGRSRAPWLLLALPALLALALRSLSTLLPQDRIWGHMLQSLALVAGPWLMLLGAVFGLGLALQRRRPGAALLALPYLLLCGHPPLSGSLQGLRVVSANVDAFSEGPAGAEATLAALEPDVLLVIERRAEVVPGLLRVADNYAVPMSRISHGHAVHCRPGLGCQAAIAPEIGSSTSIMPVGLVRVPVPRQGGGAAVEACILSIHAPPPAPLDPTGLRPYINRVAGAVREGRMLRQWGPCLAGDPVLLIGDFNHVAGAGAWRALDATGLRDAEAGWGLWRASWPAGGDWPDLPLFGLDNARVGPELVLTGLRHVRVPGSDHLALEGGLLAR